LLTIYQTTQRHIAGDNDLHEPILRYNGEAVFLLRGGNWVYKYLDEN
jgi:hypothetical protein